MFKKLKGTSLGVIILVLGLITIATVGLRYVVFPSIPEGYYYEVIKDVYSGNSYSCYKNPATGENWICPKNASWCHVFVYCKDKLEKEWKFYPDQTCGDYGVTFSSLNCYETIFVAVKRFSCIPNSMFCEGSELYRCNDQGNDKILVQSCSPGVCIQKETSAYCGICIPNYEKRCNGKQPQICNADGNGWVNFGSECDLACVNGTCITCYEGTKTCNGNYIAVCKNNNWVNEQLCNYGCENGNCKPKPAVCGDGILDIGEECEPDGKVESCTVDGVPGIKRCSNCKWSACEKVGNCVPGSTRSCGNCGTQTCPSSGKWEDAPCLNQGECSPGSTKTCVSSNGCGYTIKCTSACRWESCPTDECEPSSTKSCNIGGIPGVIYCNSDCKWDTKCIATGECVPGTKASCGQCGEKVCDSNGKWGDCKKVESVCGEGFECVWQ
jgi:hypothetical protein